MWSVNRNLFQDHYLFPCVANTPEAEFVQSIQAELRDKTGLRQVLSEAEFVQQIQAELQDKTGLRQVLSGAEFVQQIQAELQDKTGLSQVPSHRTRNGNISLLVGTKYPFCQKLILPAVLRRSTGPKCLTSQMN